MKKLHRQDLYGWSSFDEDRNIDFNSVLWVRPAGNIAIDPLPLSAHDRAHITELGSIATIIVTNSDHLRDTVALAAETGAKVFGPKAEKSDGSLPCTSWLSDGDDVVPGLSVLALEGSKTDGELALLLETTTLITGDLIRAHEGGRLCLLPEAKLGDAAKARASVARVAALPDIEAVLPGDGWPIFRGGSQALAELASQAAL